MDAESGQLCRLQWLKARVLKGRCIGIVGDIKGERGLGFEVPDTAAQLLVEVQGDKGGRLGLQLCWIFVQIRAGGRPWASPCLIESSARLSSSRWCASDKDIGTIAYNPVFAARGIA